MLIRKILSKIINVIFYFVKVKENYIVFFASRSRVDGNPKSIYLYLKENYNENFKMIYLVDRNTDISYLDKKDVCFYKTIKCYYYISKAKYWILSDNVKTLKKKKKNQIYIQTFHGHGPVKKGGFEIEKFRTGREFENGMMDYVKDWNIYISMCEKDEEHIRNATGYRGKILRLGIASTDEIVQSRFWSLQKINQLKKNFHIPLDKKVILYAPTYREHLLNQDDIDIKIEQLKKLEDYVVLVRLHPLLNSKINKKIFEKNFINVCDVSDIIDLYPVVDILISDYSAAIYEFALTNKKIILYPYDYKEYEEFPGYIIDYAHVMPGPICYTEEELYNVLKNEQISFKDYDKKLKVFNEKFNEKNDGKATKRLVEEILVKNMRKEITN